MAVRVSKVEAPASQFPRPLLFHCDSPRLGRYVLFTSTYFLENNGSVTDGNIGEGFVYSNGVMTFINFSLNGNTNDTELTGITTTPVRS
jgi:hypothetical protein